MPKIEIREVDLTGQSTAEVTTNAVFVPGYAVMGPVNTPVYCETLEEFRRIFGDLPYKFQGDQAYPTGFASSVAPSGNMYSAGDYEKSWIYAAELLYAGIPVYYVRVMKNTSSWLAQDIVKNVSGNDGTTALTIRAKEIYAGGIGANIAYAVTSSGSDKYTLKITAPDGSTETRLFTIQGTATPTYPSYKDINFYAVDLVWADGVTTLAASKGKLKLTTTTADEFTVADMYEKLSATDGIFKTIENVGDYNVKFITSGAYPLFEYRVNTNVYADTFQANAAANRHDATAIIDYVNNTSRALTGTGSVKETFKTAVTGNHYGENDLQEQVSSYITMFIPYVTFVGQVVAGDFVMPGSFAYLRTLAQSTQTNASWMAVAGVRRGTVTQIKALAQNVTNAIADSYQSDTTGDVAINPITNINPYGYVIWGNRTALPNGVTGLKASSFLNVRQLVNDIKKTVYVACRRLTFEPNSDVLWVNFKAEIQPLLERMLTGQGISKYKITRVPTTKKATVVAKIRIWPIDAVEDWDITIEMADGTTTVSE